MNTELLTPLQEKQAPEQAVNLEALVTFAQADNLPEGMEEDGNV